MACSGARESCRSLDLWVRLNEAVRRSLAACICCINSGPSIPAPRGLLICSGLAAAAVRHSGNAVRTQLSENGFVGDYVVHILRD